MVDCLINDSKKPDSGFYLNDYNALSEKLKRLDAEGEKVLLIGVSFALLDLVEQFEFTLKNTIVMETGGMAGAIFNAAKERALDAFIDKRIGFLDMAVVVERVLEQLSSTTGHIDADFTLDNILDSDHLARTRADEIIAKL